jgi:Dolichyl-phosphate-mannose-protein mannosyltransferase
MISSLRSSANPVRARGGMFGAGALTRAVRAPGVWLTFIVALSTLVRGAIATGVPSPWILPDEVVYSELAKSIAAGGFPSVRGVPELGWGVVYPALIAPAWALFDDPARAYHVALGISALVMSLAAVPAYLLARMFVSRTASVVVAAMTVAVPSMAYTGVMMTENACYPAFLLAVLLIARAVRSPSRVNQAMALAGLGLVALTRIQGVALVGAYLVAVGVYALTGAPVERSRYLRRFVPTAVVAVSLSFAPMGASVVRGDGIFGWLGVRSGTFADLHVYEVPQWFVFLIADLVLYVAVAPAAATAIVLGRGLSREASEPVRLFSAIALPTFAAMLVSVSFVSASLDVDGTENLNERYVFYVVPLLFVGLALWIREGLPRPRPWAWVTVALCCLLPALLPIGRLSYNAAFQSLALLPWLRIHASYSVVAVAVTAFTLACGAYWIACRRDRVGYLWLISGISMAMVGAIAVISNGNSATNSATAFAGLQPNWVDRAVPEGERVAVIWERGPEGRAVQVEFWIMVTELFNPSVGDVYRVGRPTYYEAFLSTIPVGVRADRGLVDEDGRRVDPRYVLVSCRTPVIGRVIARAPQGLLELVEVKQPLRMEPSRCVGRA